MALTHAQLAAKLLRDAAGFFEQIGEENPPLEQQMQENASVFQQVADLVENDPDGSPSLDLYEDQTVAPEIVTKPETPSAPSPEALGMLAPKAPWLGDEPDRMRFGWVDGGPQQWTRFDPRDQEHAGWAEAVARSLNDGATSLLGDQRTRLDFTRAPFLPSVHFAHLEAEFNGGRRHAIFALEKLDSGDWRATSLDFASENLHRLNGEHGLRLVGHELDYLEAFMTIVRADGAPFRLLHGWVRKRMQATLTEEVSEDLAKELQETLRAVPTLRLDRIHEDGAPVYAAPILYSGTLFRSWLKLDPNGMVTMLDDEPFDLKSPVRDAVAEHLVEKPVEKPRD